LRVLARTVLESFGYRVLLARDGEDAVRAYEAAKDEIDLLILDLIMPRKGGRETYEQIRSLGGHIPVIFMTGHAPELQSELIEETKATLMEKPYAIDELGRRVRDALDSNPR